MRKFLIIITIIFVAVSIVFLILPMGTIAFLPIGITIILAVITLFKSEKIKRVLPRWLIIISLFLALIAGAKVAFIKDEVEIDDEFEMEQTESTDDAKQELEEIEDLQDSSQPSQQTQQPQKITPIQKTDSIVKK